MPKLHPNVETFARMKVIGVGNSGTNSINHMIRSRVKGVEFIAVDTDAQKLHYSLAPKKIHIGKNFTRGLGGGMNPEVGKQAAEENKEELKEILKGADMIFITGGEGGATATGAAPIIAKISKEQGILTMAVVTTPFSFEGIQRKRIADEGTMNLRNNVDALITINNDRLLDLVDQKTTFLSAFKMCDEVLRQAVEGISDLIVTPGIINVDFSDIKTVMQNAGSALMGIGKGQGEKRATEAAQRAITSPLLDFSIEGAKGVLFVVSGGEDLTMLEVQEAANIITSSIDREAKVIFGAIHDDRLRKNELKITVIASGFPEAKNARKLTLFQESPEAEHKKKEKEEKVKVLEEKEEERENQKEKDWDSVPAFLRRKKL